MSFLPIIIGALFRAAERAVRDDVDDTPRGLRAAEEEEDEDAEEEGD